MRPGIWKSILILKDKLGDFLHIQERDLAPTNTILGRLQRMSRDEEIRFILLGQKPLFQMASFGFAMAMNTTFYDQPRWSPSSEPV